MMRRLLAFALLAVPAMTHTAQQAPKLKIVSSLPGIKVEVMYRDEDGTTKPPHITAEFTRDVYQREFPFVDHGRPLFRIVVYAGQHKNVKGGVFEFDAKKLGELKEAAYVLISPEEGQLYLTLKAQPLPSVEDQLETARQRIKQLEGELAQWKEKLEGCQFNLLYGRKKMSRQRE